MRIPLAAPFFQDLRCGDCHCSQGRTAVLTAARQELHTDGNEFDSMLNNIKA